ncbi:MAG: zinc-ribbon domain-containing protein [Candidatus Fervidibacter sp.]|uniref:zinc-ribbon domain-containing protein n=1 Tax=Candidatus Fervidibacter sp. TaxID=3100871 RepID=UPI00404A44ED
MQCAKCQRENEEGARFCGYCGTPLGREIRDVSASRRVSHRVICRAVYAIQNPMALAVGRLSLSVSL